MVQRDELLEASEDGLEVAMLANRLEQVDELLFELLQFLGNLLLSQGGFCFGLFSCEFYLVYAQLRHLFQTKVSRRRRERKSFV